MDIAHFLLEADRGTMSLQDRMYKKLRAYWRWFRDGGHRERLGIEAFRVLTITNSERRRDNLVKLAKQVDDAQRGSNLFLFGYDGDLILGERNLYSRKSGVLLQMMHCILSSNRDRVVDKFVPQQLEIRVDSEDLRLNQAGTIPRSRGGCDAQTVRPRSCRLGSSVRVRCPGLP